MSVIFVLWVACVQTKSLNVSNVLDRISSGDLNEKDVLDFYKKDYDASLEYHQFFQPCLSHLIREEKGKANSFINKWFPGMKNYFTSNYKELEFPDLGVKIKCEVYINKFVSKEYKLQKKEEANPYRDSYDTCKKQLSDLEKINQELMSRLDAKSESKGNDILPFNFKSDERGPKIEYQDKPSSLSIEDGKVEFQDKPERNIVNSLNLKKIKASSDSKSSTCNEELQKIKARVTRLEKDNSILEKQIVEKNRLIQFKDELNNKFQESNTKMKLDKAEKEKALNDCQNKKIELKASLEKCSVKIGTCGGSNCAECENKLITKIDESTTCEKIKKDLGIKNHELSDEITTIKIRVSALEIEKRNVEKKLIDCNSDKQGILKKLSKSESQVNKSSYKSCAELDECRKSVSEKIHEIEILKKSCNNNPAPTINTKKGTCQEENERLRTELNICNQKQIKYVGLIQEKNKIIIKKEYDISTLEIEKNNIKTEFEKIEKVCREEKDSFEKKITSLEEKVSEEKKKHQICRNELKENKIFKKKWEKCEDNNKKERTKCKEIIGKQKTEIIKLKAELDKCEKENKRFDSEIKIKISAHEICEKDKEDSMTKLKECSQKVEEETRKFTEYSNSVIIEKDRLVQQEQKNCKIQIDILNTKINNFEKEIRVLRMNQDCPVKLTKCTNEKVIIENTLKTKEAEFTRIKEEKDTCERELKLLREKYIKTQTSESVCKKTLEETRVNWRNCESKKPVPCPTIDQSIIMKIRSKYEKCNNELNIFKDDTQKYKETIEKLEKLIKDYEERKNQCVANCTTDLETCQKNIITIQNKCDEEMRLKIEEINTLKKRTHNNEEKCSKRIRDFEENNKKCIRHLKLIKTKSDECQKNYNKQVDINKKYVIEITNLKSQLNTCLKRNECDKNTKPGPGAAVCEKCEKLRSALLKETFTLKEKITKLQEEKKSIFMSSKHIINTMENKCEKDVDSYGTVMEDIETRIKHFYSVKIAIEGEIRSDEILINTKQKEINIKTEEKNIMTTEITNIRNDYERIIVEINNIKDKIRKSQDIDSIRTLTDNIFSKERELKEKNELILKTSQKEKEIHSVIVIIQEQINNYTTIKNIRMQKIKENKENIERLNKILIQIKKTIEIKRANIQKIRVKIEKFTNVRVMADARISALEKEKDKISKELETCNTKLEEEKSTNNLLHMKINKTVSTGLIDVNLLMRIFEDNSFTERNCARLNKFKAKFYSVCPMKSHTETKLHVKKHKNTPIESTFPLNAKDLGIESQEKIGGLENLNISSKSDELGEGSKNIKIESQFPLQNKDLKIESQNPLSREVLNSGVSSSSSGKNIKIESQFPLQNKDLKIESQHPLSGEILNSGVSSSLSGKNIKIESQFPLQNKDLKIESQHPLSGEVLNSGVSSSSSGKNIKIESQFPLQNKDLKVESQHPLNEEVLNSGASTVSGENSNIESKFPLKIESQGQLDRSILEESSSLSRSGYSRNRKMKNESSTNESFNENDTVESKEPLDGAKNNRVDSHEPLDEMKKFRNESEEKEGNKILSMEKTTKTEEKSEGQGILDLNQSLTKLLDAAKF